MNAEIIIPLPLKQTYTYAVPDTMQSEIAVGMRVIVHFGVRKFYTGIVKELHWRTSEYKLKKISSLLDKSPVVSASQLLFWEFISNYYAARLGDVYKAALPVGFRIESETVVMLNPHHELNIPLFGIDELVCNLLLTHKKLSISQLNKESNKKDVLPIIRRLLLQEIIVVEERLTKVPKPKLEAFVTSNFDAEQEEQVGILYDSLKRSPKQQHLFITFLALYKIEKRPVSRDLLLKQANCTLSIYQNLEKKEIVKTDYIEISRLKQFVQSQPLNQLSEDQMKAYKAIKEQFKEKNVVLLHGVTSSGKTELYLHLIAETLAKGEQVLYLVPEIGLTTQLTIRLSRVLGKQLGVYHSRLSDNQRVEIWNNLLQVNLDNSQVILGVRSSVFLPFQNLGLIIVDEEHDASFKQSDTTPRYHSRNAALKLAHMHNAKTVLGSATPSIESYCLAMQGRYGLVTLATRFSDIKMPNIKVVDIKESYRKKRMKGYFSLDLIHAIEQTLANKEQVILFQNRRGYAPYLQCPECAWVPHCNRCDVSLTYHKMAEKLTCHYCGYTISVIETCPTCNSKKISTHGFGTEQIASEVKQLFPEAKVERMDLDTTRNKDALLNIITDFSQQQIDILVGTQMITKGFDFDNVGLVGILNADNLFFYPDFRANERAFQTLSQVSGRAGRKHKQGLVILQTFSPQSPIINDVVSYNYRHFFETQMFERQEFNYPPYCRIILLMMKHKNANVLQKASYQLAEQLRSVFAHRVLGPDNPLVGRIQNQYLKQILLKIEVNASQEKAKELIIKTIDALRENEEFKFINISLDVDPM